MSERILTFAEWDHVLEALAHVTHGRDHTTETALRDFFAPEKIDVGSLLSGGFLTEDAHRDADEVHGLGVGSPS